MSLEQVEFAENPEPRCPVVLLLDTSGSMSGAAISELNAGLQEFSREVKADALASLRIEIAVVTFGGSVNVVQPFTAMHAFNPPTLTTHGGTPMGQAVRDGLQMIRDRKDTYKQNAIDYYRPWIFLITDGAPTDAGWEAAAQEARDEEANKRVLFFAVGTEGANMQTLARFSDKRAPVRLKGLAFRELFQWLSKSMSTVSRSRMGDTVELPPPTGWAQITT